MGLGICPECGSDNVGKESGRWGHTGDWICFKCKCSGHPDIFTSTRSDSKLDKKPDEKTKS